MIALISTDGANAVQESTTETVTQKETTNIVNDKVAADVIAVNESSDNIDRNGPSGKFYSPLVRSIAEKEGISTTQLIKTLKSNE